MINYQAYVFSALILNYVPALIKLFSHIYEKDSPMQKLFSFVYSRNRKKPNDRTRLQIFLFKNV